MHRRGIWSAAAMTLRERRWVCLTRGRFRVGTGGCGSIDGEFVSGQETEKKMRW